MLCSNISNLFCAFVNAFGAKHSAAWIVYFEGKNTHCPYGNIWAVSDSGWLMLTIWRTDSILLSYGNASTSILFRRKRIPGYKYNNTCSGCQQNRFDVHFPLSCSWYGIILREGANKLELYLVDDLVLRTTLGRTGEERLQDFTFLARLNYQLELI